MAHMHQHREKVETKLRSYFDHHGQASMNNRDMFESVCDATVSLTLENEVFMQYNLAHILYEQVEP